MDPRVLRAYQEALASLMVSVNRDTATLFGRLIRSADPVEVREALELAVPSLVEQYGQVAGELSAEWFTALDPSDGYRPVVPAPTNAEQVARSAAWAAQPLFDGAPAVALSRLSGSVERHVRGMARQTIIHNSERLGVPFARVARADACPFCRMLAGRGFVYADDATAGGVTGSDYHDACVPADTVVSGPLAEHGTRRWYEGELVTIYTTSGKKLAITPNHPVLTGEGWVPAGLLHRGSNVVGSTVAQPVPVSVPDEHQQPALIEDVWGSLAVDGLARVPGSAEDFHGDGADREVQVVGPDSDLRTVGEAALVEHLRESVLAGAGRASGTFAFADLGELATSFPGLAAAPNGFVGGSGVGFALCGAHAAHADQVRLAAASTFDAKILEVARNHVPAHTEFGRDVEFGQLLVDVHPANRVGVKVQSVSRRFDPAGAESPIEVGSAYARLGNDLFRCLSGQVELDRVVEVRRSEFLGHVFNLQTTEGWYAASNVIVSNCRCVALPKRRGIDEADVPNLDRFRDQYMTAVSGVSNTSGKDALREILSRMDDVH